MKWSQRVLSVCELRLTHFVPDSRGREHHYTEYIELRWGQYSQRGSSGAIPVVAFQTNYANMFPGSYSKVVALSI